MAEFPDDIPDPIVPPTMHTEPLPPPDIDLSQLKDICVMYVHDAMEAVRDDALATMAKLTPPALPSEEARITALSPEGFTVTLVTRKLNASDMVEALEKMRSWLQAAGYLSTQAPF